MLIKYKFRKIYLLLLIFFIINLSNSATAPPTNVPVSPYYFGSHYIKLSSSQKQSSPIFTSESDTFQMPLMKVYSNIKQYTIITSSFQCESSYDFGYKLSISITSDPTTKVYITFEQTILSTFSMIGVSAIIVTDPFDKMMSFIQYDMDIEFQSYSKSVTLPANYQCRKYVKSATQRSLATSNYLYVYININIIISTNTINMSYYSNTPFSTVSDIYNVQAILIILDKDIQSTILQLNFLIWNIVPIPYQTFLTHINFGIDTTRYGYDFNKKCILGFPVIDFFNLIKPYFIYDLDPLVGISTTNRGDNSISHSSDFQSFCFRDLQCPTSNPYKKINDNTNCWDCSGGAAVNPKIIDNCDLYDTTFQKINVDIFTGQIIKYCLKCMACEDHYYVDNSLCMKCNSLYPNCQTCNQKIQCLTCFKTHSLDSGNLCQLCASFPQMLNCVECSSSSVCQKCQDGYYLQLNVCKKCSQKMKNCIKCSSSTNCLGCVKNMSVKSMNTSECVCGEGKPVTGTCSKVEGCISSHEIDNVTLCYSCNTTFHWDFTLPHNCSCKRGYKLSLSNKTCILNCGDGNWIDQQCDDGNLINGDGCSSICKKQPQFQCQNIKFKKSICRFQPQITSSVYSLTRNYGTGNLVLKLKFNPFNSIIRVNNWVNNIHINSTKITFISYQFQNQNILVLTYFINESIQHQTLNWQLVYDSDKFKNTQYNLNILMRGTNAPLTYEPYYKHQYALQIVSYIIGGIAFVIGIVAMIKAESNIGFEIITSVLYIFYARILSYENNSAILYTMNGLRVACGYNEYFPDQQRDYIQYISKTRFNIMSELDLMILGTMIILGLILIIKLIFKIKSIYNIIYGNKIQIKQEMKQQQKQWKLFKAFTKAFTDYQYLQNKFCTPFILIYLFNVFIAFNSFENTGSLYQPRFNPTINNLILLLFFTILIYYLITTASIIGNLLNKMEPININDQKLIPNKLNNNKNNNTNKNTNKNNIYNNNNEDNTKQYKQLYFIYLLITSIIIFFTMDFTQQIQNVSYITQISLGLILIYLIIIIIWNPYNDKLNKYAIIINQLVKIIFIIFLLLLQRGLLTHLIQLIGVYIFLILLLGLQIISIVRIKKTWRRENKSESDEYDQTMKLKRSLKSDRQKKMGYKQYEQKMRKKMKSRVNYIRDDDNNQYRYENIIKKDNQQQQNRKMQYLYGYTNKNNNKNTNKNNKNKSDNNRQQSIQKKQSLSSNKQIKNNSLLLLNNNINANISNANISYNIGNNNNNNNNNNNIQESVPQSTIIDKQKSEIGRIKQRLRNNYNKMRQQKQKQINNNYNYQQHLIQLRLGISSFDNQLQKKYQYDKWKVNNKKQALKQQKQLQKIKYQKQLQHHLIYKQIIKQSLQNNKNISNNNRKKTK